MFLLNTPLELSPEKGLQRRALPTKLSKISFKVPIAVGSRNLLAYSSVVKCYLSWFFRLFFKAKTIPTRCHPTSFASAVGARIYRHFLASATLIPRILESFFSNSQNANVFKGFVR